MERETAAAGPVRYVVHRDSVTAFDGLGVSRLGAWVTQRRAAGNMEIAYQGNGLTPHAIVSGAVPTVTMNLFCVNVSGAGRLLNSNPRLSAFSMGNAFAGDAEWLEYRSIWETFQTTLSRPRP